MLTRTGFKRTPYKPAPTPPITPPTRWGNTGQVAALLRPIPKQEAVRSEPYRRLVAQRPCKACGIVGYSQAAHIPPDAKGMKQDDRLTFALCCTRPGIIGCHVAYDQFRMFPKREAVTVGLAWAADTRRAIETEGLWPKNLPKWSEA